MMKFILLTLGVCAVSGCVSTADRTAWTAPVSEYRTTAVEALAQTPATATTEPLELPEPNGVLTLRSALALTLMRNPALKAFSFETRAAGARALQASLRPNPELGIEVEDFGGSGNLSGFDGAESTIQLRQLIELGNKAEKRHHVAAYDRQLAEWDYETQRVAILTEAGKAFITLLAIQEKEALLAQLVELSERTLYSVSQRVESGKDSPLEETKASVAVSGMQIEYEQARKELETARKRLASFWDSQEPLFTRAAGQLDTVSPVPNLDKLEQALFDNPQLARWETQIARDKAAIRLAESKAVPDITVGGGVKRFHEIDDNAFVFGISIPLPVSDRNQGGRMEATYNLAKSRQEQRAARTAMLNRLREAHTDLSIAADTIRSLLETVLPGAQTVYDASREAYAQGKIDYLQVLDAQRTYFVSQSEYIEALAAYHLAKTELEGLTATAASDDPLSELAKE